MADTGFNEHTELHVFDLPQIYQKPEAAILLDTLRNLREAPYTFGRQDNQTSPVVNPAGIPRYLTSIVSSSLSWVTDDDLREQIWHLASLRMNERSGSNAAPAQTRTFEVESHIVIQLHEPSLTEDNLGFKTWGSSLLMSKQLTKLRAQAEQPKPKVLELGAGTGLVGISCSCLWQCPVTLTDLPDIVPNLETNLALNAGLIQSSGGEVRAAVLDWSDTADGVTQDADKFDIILAADPIYSPDHPKMLVSTILKWLRWAQSSRIIIELPIRKHYAAERSHLKDLLMMGGLCLILEGEESGYDDWTDSNGNPVEVECWWGVWIPDKTGN